MCFIYKEIRNNSVKLFMLKKIIISVYLGFVLFSFITFFSGRVGLSNMKALNYFKTDLISHVDNLEMKSLMLQDEITRLTDSEDRLKVAARPLGYIEPGQKVIKVLNNKPGNNLYKIDRQYSLKEFKSITNKTLLVSSLFTAILFVISLFIGVIRDTYKGR